jgi:hypothetical protein
LYLCGANNNNKNHKIMTTLKSLNEKSNAELADRLRYWAVSDDNGKISYYLSYRRTDGVYVTSKSSIRTMKRIAKAGGLEAMEHDDLMRLVTNILNSQCKAFDCLDRMVNHFYHISD